jgi:Ser/Thr protein kinase RdoA (MazF antagonist)
MCNENKLHLIDFDDGGFGYRLFELATALLKYHTDPEYPVFESALIEGYSSLRTIDTTPLPLFLALRATTYVGWNISRMAEDETGARNARFIRQAENFVNAYLGT